MQNRNLCDIAQEIRACWEYPFYGAVPYLEAMACMTSVDKNYGAESGKSIVRGFLCNAQYWRGGNARRIKAELRALVE